MAEAAPTANDDPYSTAGGATGEAQSETGSTVHAFRASLALLRTLDLGDREPLVSFEPRRTK